MSAQMTTVLAVDDEPKILEALASLLESRGYRVLTASDGRGALEAFEKNSVSLVVLDLMLPDMSGEEVCAAIRKKSRVPVLMLTARSDEDSQLSGLETGADDYVTKPFSLRLLAARVEALLRRSPDSLRPLSARNSWRGGDLTADFERGVILKRGTPVRLTPMEYRILCALTKYPGKVFTRDELITLAFDADFDSFDRAVDYHVKNLRRKIEDDTKNPVYVLTVRGLGYKFGGE